MNQSDIGKFISSLRKKKKLTQSELAEKLGVSVKSVSNWENGRNMPDLSLFKPLCNELGITVNDLISGEIVDDKKYKEVAEDNIIKTIDYSNKNIRNSKKVISLSFIVFGVLLTNMALTIIPSESSWGSIYSVIGCLISIIGFFRLINKCSWVKRILYSIVYFVIYVIMLIIIDYVSVISNNQAPRFSYLKIYDDNMILYRAFNYDVYRINVNKSSEYYIIDKDKKYTMDTVPNIPFNRSKCGIDNIIKYKSLYVGDNSNDGNLVSNLPLSEYGYVFSIDNDNLGLIINYNITDWYINSDNYIKKSLIYNSVSIFFLIDNIEYITFNFSGNSYKITRNNIEKYYPDYEKIKYDTFSKYVENIINDDEIIENIFDKLFS